MTATAYVQGKVVVAAKDSAQAEEKAKAEPGNVEWKYDGLHDDAAPSVDDVRLVSEVLSRQ